MDAKEQQDAAAQEVRCVARRAPLQESAARPALRQQLQQEQPRVLAQERVARPAPRLPPARVPVQELTLPWNESEDEVVAALRQSVPQRAQEQLRLQVAYEAEPD